MRQHNHIFQHDDGFEGCPACDSIDDWHMTVMYVNQAWNEYLQGL